MRAGDLVIDLVRAPGHMDGEPVQLTPTEMRLLEVLLANRGKLVTREQLLETVWGSRARRATAAVSASSWCTCVASCTTTPPGPRLILTEPGIGYRWIGDDEDSLD